MSPAVALVIVAIGAGAIFVLTSRPRTVIPGHDNITAPGGFTQAQLDYYLGGLAPHLSGAQAAQLGAGSGAPFAAATFGISIGIGALAGWLMAAADDPTEDHREAFARRLGFTGDALNARGVMVRPLPVTSLLDKTHGLYPYLWYIGRSDLASFAINKIPDTNYDLNTQWLVDTLAALWHAGFPFPK